MQSKGNAPNPAQVKWREDVRQINCVVTGSSTDIQIHHVVGCTGKHNKKDIGHWWILPVTENGHRIIERAGKKEQAEKFIDVCRQWKVNNPFQELPFPREVYESVMEYRR